MTTRRIMIVVTHLRGAGHLSRALTLGRAFAAAGHAAHVVSGGFEMPQFDTKGVTLHQLPPLRVEGTDYSTLFTRSGTVAGPEDFDARQAMLLQRLAEIAPDVLITELFPFGRRNLRGEFLALLEAARAMETPPRIYASIRDILEPPSKPAKAAFAADTVSALYDGVLVHSDAAVIPLEASWPVPPELSPKLIYTGFVAPPAPERAAQPGDEILVSEGGGTLGDDLLPVALEAAARDTRPWRILVGGHDPQARAAQFQHHASDRIIIEPARPDFRDLLAKAAASVSLCGYNTSMDILQTGVPAVLVPYDGGTEQEQILRARALARLPGVAHLPRAALTSDSLLEALHIVQSAPNRVPHRFRFDGAEQTVRLCLAGAPHGGPTGD